MDSAQPLAGMVAVVAGATRGIGRATAETFARQGASVVIVGRSTDASPHPMFPGTVESVTAALRDIGADVEGVAADGSSEEGVELVASCTLARFGRCDILVNNYAYSTDFGAAAVTPIARWNTAWKVNVIGPLRLCQAFVPGMVERGSGHVVNVSTGAAVTDVAGVLPYGATKAALERMTIGFAGDYGTSGVAFDVLRVDEAVPTDTYLMVQAQIGTVDRMHALPTPEEVGKAIAWMVAHPSGGAEGRIMGFDDLRSLGAMPPASFVIGQDAGR
jgi:NAD(P)-dependent dehydrogenase (short-subunit alcohol dehydrogenase family)